MTAPAKMCRRTNSNTITRVNCPENIELYKYTDGSYEAVYYWCHFKHNPTDSEEIIASRLPEKACKWITERVDENMDWEAMQNVLRLTRKERDDLDENRDVSPISSIIKMFKTSFSQNLLDCQKNQRLIKIVRFFGSSTLLMKDMMYCNTSMKSLIDLQLLRYQNGKTQSFKGKISYA